MDDSNSGGCGFLAGAGSRRVRTADRRSSCRAAAGLAALESLQRQQQASTLAYFDVFLMLTVVTLELVPVVLLMKRPAAWKAAHIESKERG
jgi:DHA2 family multidrug resistance protein